jgi:hypothetical protein
MFNAHNSHPLTTAIAAGTVARVGGSLMSAVSDWLPGMAKRIAPHPIDRGVSR